MLKQDQKPFISIIIATYNSGKVLERCIGSIKNQNYKNFELIIIDANSTDNTIDIIKKYDDVVSKWISENDKGIYDAWNKGVKLAEGEWVTFIGSDDFFYPTALSDYVDFINSYNEPGLEFVSSKMHLVNQKDKIIRSLGLPWDWKIGRLKNTIAHPGSLHHKRLFEDFGLFDINFKICGDYEFLLRPGSSFKTAFMDKFTVRMAQGGVSSNGAKLFKEHRRAAKTTGKLHPVIADYYYLLQLTKHYVKLVIRKFNIDI